jgi:DNA polymerase theta
MELLLAQFHTRLIFGIEKELCDLVKISLLNGCRARVLYNSGYHTLFALASANPSAIEFTLRKAFPFNNNKGDAATVNWCSHLRKGLTEVDAAILIVQEAQFMLCQEMNIPLAAWKKIHSIPDFSKIDENRVIEVKPPKITTPTTVEQLRYSRKQTIASHHTLKVNDIYPKRLKLEDNAGDISDHLIAPNTSVDLFTDDSGVMNAMETSNQVDDEKDKYLDDDVISMFFSDTLNDCSVICLDNDAATNLFTCPDSGLSVIDLSIDSKSLQAFIDQCTGGNINLLSFSVAIENVYTNDCIGASVIKPISKVKGLPVPMSNKQVMGVAFYCGDGMQVYYLPLNQCSNKEVSKEETDACPVVSLSTRLEAISSLLSTLTKLTAVNFKQQIKYLISLCHDVKACSPCDPHVANWLIDPDADQKTLQDLVTIHLPDQPVIRKDDDGDNLPLSSIIDHPAFSSHLRAAAESIISFALMKKLEPLLCTENLLQAFCTSEMQMIIILAKMETNGIGFALEQCNKIRDDLKLHLTKLEQDAYKLAKRKFALSSPIEVGKVLFQELKLPSFQTDRKIDAKKLKNHQLQRLSTSKEILQKLVTLHPLPGTILEWRRVNNTLTRTIYPLYKHAMTHSQLDGCVRIHTTYEFHTSTGRIITSNPNIQTVPKDYSLYVYEGNDNPTIKNDDKSYILQQSQEVVSMRNVFTSFPNGVFVSADYSQLELRVLAHLSNDEKLCLILNEEGDAFRSIAAEWKGVQPSQITEQERQQTKQMCYGMIYGIGAQSLSEQLGVDQNSAINFLESFKSRYSGMSNFIKETVQNCQLNGHIKTLLNRKRHLPAIHSSDGALRSQAQRQAINSTVQGSAADIVKKAMIDIDNTLRGSGLITCLSQSSDKIDTGKFALLVLQLHDELVYEVHESKLQKVAEIVRNGMENVMALKVKLPVKLHTGKSWGQLQPYL